MRQLVAQHLRSCLRVAASVACLSWAECEWPVDALSLILDALMVDWVVFHVILLLRGWEHVMDEHLPAVAVALSRVACLWRADTAPEPHDARLRRSALEGAWCCACIFVCFHIRVGKRRHTQEFFRALFMWFLNLQFLAAVLLTASRYEEWPWFALRAAIFCALCGFLYSEPLQDPMMGPRAYLVCFLPVLIVSPPLAFTFAPLAVCVVCMRRERQQEDTSELI